MAALTARAEEPAAPGPCDLPCVFETLWEEIKKLDEKDRLRLEPIFVQTLAVSGEPALIDTWETRLGVAVEPAEPFENYALTKVSGFIETDGWDAFFWRAQSGEHPFNSGRPEMMASAAQHLADEETAESILDLMEQLAKADTSKAAFERASFGHVLAELAMHRCDLDAFDRALRLTDAPGAFRYAVWRTRMIGDVGHLIPQVKDGPDKTRAMNLRQVMDGLSDVLVLKTCEAS